MSIIVPKKFYKKSLGQHLLKDAQVLNDIITASDLTAQDKVLEIGAGSGILSEKIIPRVNHLTAVELDEGFKPFLRNLATLHPNMKVIFGDICRLKLEQVLSPPPPLWRVMGNLPYQITSAVLTKIISLGNSWLSDAVFMVQKEVGERLTASSGKAYGSFSIWVQFYCHTDYLFTVPAQAFFPAPKVESCVIRLRFRRQTPYAISDIDFFNFCRQLFTQRRKQLLNSLKLVLPLSDAGQREKLITQAGLRATQRIEEIPGHRLAILYAGIKTAKASCV